MPFLSRIRIRDFQAPGRTAMEYQLFGIISHPGNTIYQGVKTVEEAKNDSGAGKNHSPRLDAPTLRRLFFCLSLLSMSLRERRHE
ncbi:MAG: hypothetical protein L6422_12750 [Candidatus Marinimicrobia bacterium]|nr:hypothetical protein [bacterium]MCG2717115.1 hypothetical protein [Candidatus Neomarinimicrobiota bacterium]